MTYALAAAALFGHVTVFIAVLNRIHGTGLPRKVLAVFDLFWLSFGVGVPALAGWIGWQGAVADRVSWEHTWWYISGHVYVPFAWLSAMVGLCVVARRALGDATTPRLLTNHTAFIDISERLGHVPAGDLLTRWLARVPGNEIFHLSVHDKHVSLSRLDARLGGLSIAHLSDLHLTGQLSRAFYDEIIYQTNALQADLIAITGDIIEEACCLDWLAGTLGQLRARYGVYFVLGNHELRLRDIARVRQCLTECGLVDLGRSWRIVQHAECSLVLGGNELPWHRPAVDWTEVPRDASGCRPLRILLAHSPDQLNWARSHDVDLMLAGHTHGGQVRLPWIGPILAPSLYGVRHASGTFYCEPTLLHVSRGIAGTRPLRWNCPPELTRLILHPEQS